MQQVVLVKQPMQQVPLVAPAKQPMQRQAAHFGLSYAYGEQLNDRD